MVLLVHCEHSWLCACSAHKYTPIRTSLFRQSGCASSLSAIANFTHTAHISELECIPWYVKFAYRLFQSLTVAIGAAIAVGIYKVACISFVVLNARIVGGRHWHWLRSERQRPSQQTHQRILRNQLIPIVCTAQKYIILFTYNWSSRYSHKYSYINVYRCFFSTTTEICCSSGFQQWILYMIVSKFYKKIWLIWW